MSETRHAAFTIERVYDASPEEVFAAWADPDARRRWFVEGEGFEIRDYTLDFRVGGREFGSFKFRDGQYIHNHTQFFEIIANRRIIFGYSMGFGDAVFSVSLATIELKAEGERTRLVFTEQAVFLEGADGPDIRKAGWEQLLGKLGEEIEQMTQDSRRGIV